MAEFPVGDFVVEVVRDSDNPRRWIVNVRHSDGQVVPPLNREWFVNQGPDDFLHLMPSSKGGNAVDALDGLKMQVADVVEYMRNRDNNG